MTSSSPPQASSQPDVDISFDSDISLQIPGGPRSVVRLLGKVPGQYMVLRGARNGTSLDGLDFRYGDSVILRYLHDGVAYAFRALVLHMARSPERLLFVAYPRTQVERYPLREAPRLSCTLPCLAVLDDGPRPALLVDLSETGSQCVLPLPTEGEAALPEEIERIELLLPDPELGEQNVEGNVRWLESGERGLRLGVQFAAPQEEYFARMAELIAAAH